MAEKDLQKQINEINEKLDEILVCATRQRLRTAMMDDLLADLSIIGKDAFHSTVTELDRQGIELDLDDLKYLVLKIIKNLDRFTNTLSVFESAYDLVHDMGPVAREVIIDFIKKLHQLEQKGYFSFFSEMLKVMDKVVTYYKPEDIKYLAENIVPMLDTIKNIMQPDIIKALNNAANTYHSLDLDNIPEYSVWKVMKELRTPEMKSGMGFLITFLKNLSEKKITTEKALSH